MESRCKTGMVMPSNRSGGGVRLQFDGVQVLGYRGLLMFAVLFVTATTFGIEEVRCITTDADVPAPTPSTQTQNIAVFNQFEADVLNAIFQIWTEQNPQLSTILHWSLEQHPCNNLTRAYEHSTRREFEGAWRGVQCTSQVRNLTEYPRHYEVSVTGLVLFGSNVRCRLYLDYYNECGFDGITGELPSEIGNLTNLVTIQINYNPGLTGPVPVELFQMPSLTTLELVNNSLSGTLPSDVYNADCQLEQIDLSWNNFSGSLRVNSQGTLFCSYLQYLSINHNRLTGPVPVEFFQMPNLTSLHLKNNSLSGTLPSDVYNADCQLYSIDLSNNNFSGNLQVSSQGTLFCSSLIDLKLGYNSLSGTLPSDVYNCQLDTIDLSNNNFSENLRVSSQGTLFCLSLRNLNISNNNLSGPIFEEFFHLPFLSSL